MTIALHNSNAEYRQADVWRDKLAMSRTNAVSDGLGTTSDEQNDVGVELQTVRWMPSHAA